MAQYKALFIAGNTPVYQQDGGAVSEDDTVTPSVALALNDTVDLVKVSGGTRLQYLSKFNGDFDTGTTLTYSLGYRAADPGGVLATNATYFGTGFTDLQAAVLGSARTQFAFAPIDFNEDVIIFMTVTAAATGVSGTPSITTLALGKARGVK
jgi:hypothetical protein